MTDWNAYYQTRFRFDPRRDTVWRAICKWLQSEVPRTGVVAEFGAGYCHFINNIQAGRRIALDISPTVIEAAAPGVEAHIASCMSCDFLADQSVDVVFASNLFEHLTISEVLCTLQQAHRIL